MKEYKLIFYIYLSILFVFIVFFLSAVHNSPVNNSMHEWVINYQGGFTRRGFLGEIVFQITQILNFQLKKPMNLDRKSLNLLRKQQIQAKIS